MKTLKIISAIALLCVAMPVFAQQTAQQTQESILISLIWGLFIMLTVLILSTLVAVWQLYNVLNKRIQTQEVQEEKLGFWEKLLGLKPMSMEKSLLIDEDYDGIQELRNPIPAWFNALFYGTILFGVVYMIVYHVTYSWPLSAQEYEEEVRLASIAKEEYLKKVANSIDETNVEATADAGEIQKGKEIFSANCAACHGKLGEGGVGPNLTDEYWLHGGDIKSIFKTIKYGVPEKGMIPWQSKLNPVQMRAVSSFILTLQGTNPPNGKEPQGEKIVASK